MSKSFIILFVLLLQSCSSFIKNAHKQFDEEERQKRIARTANKTPYSSQNAWQRQINNNPHTLNGQRINDPRFGKRRMQTTDLEDNTDGGSLWNGKNADSFLFVSNNVKKQGDIVIVDVMKKFKEEITNELKRAFPEPKKKSTKDDEEKKKETAKTETAKPAAPEAAKAPEEATDPNKVYDKISTTVVEQINKDYLLIRGRKEVMFKEAKRYVEVQGIVSNKSVNDNDTVSSKNLLEPKIYVLRY